MTTLAAISLIVMVLAVAVNIMADGHYRSLAEQARKANLRNFKDVPVKAGVHRVKLDFVLNEWAEATIDNVLYDYPLERISIPAMFALRVEGHQGIPRYVAWEPGMSIIYVYPAPDRDIILRVRVAPHHEH